MQGYLGRPDKTAEVLKDGCTPPATLPTWKKTAFSPSPDRLSRFSKIAGEMVPHIKIEDKLHELADSTEQVFAVAAVPDEKKGERIVVLHTLSMTSWRRYWKNSRNAIYRRYGSRVRPVFHVDALPYLGTGKLDLRGVKSKAADFPALEAKLSPALLHHDESRLPAEVTR